MDGVTNADDSDYSYGGSDNEDNERTARAIEKREKGAAAQARVAAAKKRLQSARESLRDIDSSDGDVSAPKASPQSSEEHKSALRKQQESSRRLATPKVQAKRTSSSPREVRKGSD